MIIASDAVKRQYVIPLADSFVFLPVSVLCDSYDDATLEDTYDDILTI